MKMFLSYSLNRLSAEKNKPQSSPMKISNISITDMLMRRELAYEKRAKERYLKKEKAI